MYIGVVIEFFSFFRKCLEYFFVVKFVSLNVELLLCLTRN